MNKGVERISGSGLASLLFMFIIGSSLTVPMASVAGHDAWISILLAMVASLGIVWVYTKLCQLYPGKSLIQIGEALLGVWAGRLLGICYAWYAFHLGVLVLRNLTELILMFALTDTPPVVISAAMMLIVLWVCYAGIEVICRCSIILLGYVLLEGMASVLLMGKDFDFGNLLPVSDKGWTPIMQGMTELVGFPFGETVLFAMIIPHFNKIGEVKKTVMWTFIAAGLLLLMINVRNTLVLGGLAAKMIYPSYTAYQYISIADFIERVEPVQIVTWVMGVFIKASVCLYVCAKSLSTTFSAKRYRAFLIPLSLLMLEVSVFIYKDNSELIRFATRVWQWYSAPFQIIIPFLLLLSAYVMKYRRRLPDREAEQESADQDAKPMQEVTP